MYDVDVLLVAHTRADYLALSLPRLLDTLPSGARAWIWQNGTDDDVSGVIREHRAHPRFHRFHRSETNVRLTAPTNWLWRESRGRLLSKVDDDCLVSDGWVETFSDAHRNPNLGIVSAWHFQPEDLLPETIERRTTAVIDGHELIRNCWVGGSGYLMKRECVNRNGYLTEKRTFTRYCIDLASDGWLIGWHHPLVLQDHMDDPRSPNSKLRDDEDLLRRAPLSAGRLSDMSIDAWQQQLRQSAITIQTASLRPGDHYRVRDRLRRTLRRS